MRMVLASLLVLAACASPAGVSNAQAPAPPQTAAAATAPASAPITYTIDPVHSQVAFSVDRFGLNRVIGAFNVAGGEIILDEAHPERSSVRATIEVGSLWTNNPERDGFLRGQFWLRADAFPTMEFRSTSVRLTGPHNAEVTGELSLAGVTAPVSFNVTLNRRGVDPASRRAAAGFSASGSLLRSQFGVRTAPPIGDEVLFFIEALGLTGEAAPAPQRPPGAPTPPPVRPN
jgi:polyisoprenoid-binding protein YceI